MFLSQRPNNDPAPFHKKGTGIRSDTNIHSYGEWEFDPRPEFTQTRDPKPWDLFGVRFAIRPITPGAVWIPRHEEFDTPVNTILSLMWKEIRDPSHPSIPSEPWLLAERWLGRLDYLSNPHEEVDHARRVLSKLVAVYS